MTARPVGPVRARVGESACWSARDQRLYSVDIWSNRLWRHDVATGAATCAVFDEMASAVVVADTGVVVALESHLLHGTVDGADWRRIDAPADHPAEHRFNDACVDPQGRLIISTMRNSRFGSAREGRLLRLDAGGWTCLAEGFWTLNGLAFSPDGGTLYWSDSHPSVQTVWHCDYDGRTLAGASPFARFDDLAGRPDGAAVDADGGYWSAGVGGGELYRFAPDGRLDRTIALPIENPTRPAFGGPGLDRLFVTSMGERLTRPDPDGLAGAVLTLGVGVEGAAMAVMAVPESTIAARG
jgi:sugar lactone lactonase YvrE